MTTEIVTADLDPTDVEELVAMVWESVLEEPVTVGEPVDTLSEWLVGRIGMTGPWPGEISVLCPTDLADRLAMALFALDADQVDDEGRRDALAELTNMTGGNLKALVSGSNQLTLPTVTTWSDLEPETFTGNQRRLASELWFDAAGFVFGVRVTEAANN